ncbi:MAG: hypothetical protein U9R72_09465 [Chloroflexota bacterium]|nr:hypothetical protein [Chloroflexota bacterium]
MRHRPLPLVLSMALLVSCSLVPTSGVDPTLTPTTSPMTAAAAATAPPAVDRTALPSATPAPALDPTMAIEIAAAGPAAAQQRGIEPLCLRWEDTDGDGEPEWLGVYVRPTDPPRLAGFIVDGDSWYELEAVEEEKYGLGEHAVCDVEADDVNADGQVEIIIWGHAETTIELLHVFVWRNSGYEEIASFQSDAGLAMTDVDGHPGQEIIVRQDVGDGLAWETIHAWDGTDYAWVWERYGWLYADHPHAYVSDEPKHAVISFYLALDDRDMREAYNLLACTAQAAQPYESWAVGFDSTLAVEVGSVHEIRRGQSEATVTAQVRSYDNLDGYIVGRLWDVTWSLVYEGETWRLSVATNNELERWEAPYFK